jgi:hypothetical protein
MINLGLKNIVPDPPPTFLQGPLRTIVSILALVFTSALAVAMGVVWSVAVETTRGRFLLLGMVLGILFVLQVVIFGLVVGVFKLTRGEEDEQ